MQDPVCGRLFDAHVFGERGGVNPSVTDSSTFAFEKPETMEELFSHEIEGRFLYSRHSSPANRNLAEALALLEGAEAAVTTASGMSAISCALMQQCGAGDEIVASRTLYGGTYALLKHVLPRFGIETRFVDINDLDEAAARLGPRTKAIFCESISNPMLEAADIPALSRLAKARGVALMVDNTFSPLIIQPARLGADVTIYSLTKFVNGASDCLAGAICGASSFVDRLKDVCSGMAMLAGPALDGFRAAQIRKNLHTLHLRMRQHSDNALRIAQALESWGLKVHYPGLASSRWRERMRRLANLDYGFGGVLTLDVGDRDAANRLMARMSVARVGLLAVSLGYFRTLFCAPGSSTSSEIPPAERARMGLSPGLIRISAGLEPHVGEVIARLRQCLAEVGLIGRTRVLAASIR